MTEALEKMAAAKWTCRQLGRFTVTPPYYDEKTLTKIFLTLSTDCIQLQMATVRLWTDVKLFLFKNILRCCKKCEKISRWQQDPWV